jgi:hypothetical protein
MHSLWLFWLSAFIPVTYASIVPQTLQLQRRASPNSTQLPSFDAKLQSNRYGTTFAVNVTLGNQIFPLLVDTGSSDLWVLQEGWTCINDTSNAILPQEACTFGPKTYQPSSTFEPITGEFFGEQLGNGRVSGVLGREDVTIGGAIVKGQIVGIANVTSNPGDGVYSGIFGLAYPVWTSAHPGSITNQSNNTYDYDRAVYSPFFNSLYQQGQVEPYFSMALERTPLTAFTGSGGYLTLGGLPPVSHAANFSRVPVEITPIPVNITDNKAQPSWWTINVGGVAYAPAGHPNNLTTNSTQFLAVVDTGNWFSFLPGDLADIVNSRFDPPGVLDQNSFPITYQVNCNATAPTFGFTLGNQTFFHNSQDLIIDSGDGTCISALIPFKGVSYASIIENGAIIGASFLKNVVAVYDFGNNEMRFAARTDDAGNSSSTTPSTSSSSSPILGSSTHGLMVAMLLACMIGIGGLNVV